MAVLQRHPPASLRALLRQGARSADGGSSLRCACLESGAAPALAVALRQELASAAAEGAEAAVRLFLFWAAPQTAAPTVPGLPPLPAQHAGLADGCCAGASASSTSAGACEAASRGRSAGSSSGLLGALDAASLSRALHGAVAANHPVIVGQLLHHCASTAWRAAALRPAALHAAVSEGHVEVLRLLLAAGATHVVMPPKLEAASAAGHSSGSTSSAGSAHSTASTPPPPLQAESWGAAVLCAAAACKRGAAGASQAMVDMLLEHGFGAYARDAMRLVACGRVAPWSEAIANKVLGAAFSAMSV
eukprot:CAMPEP_0202862054 /NCGR_PEP_ID=MMETSP1391-20130828/3234_1 /ASSEMBLY_ACC=CAM_ASM_000867 /TAXON_ID=1034604 /ORGANISM="Chlamydomonas leiostraca, Strain SAG 11-49" /LENGTH=303 /DNA_ID=CAMNT_0049541537 /DNA_START=83 /DNA_END=994 /DNA_ORIENTATION=+